jgi:alpha-glucuronidase
MDGSLFNLPRSAVAGVANIGNDMNLTGHQFGQANWYAFGRLAWDHQFSAGAIAEEWVRQTFSNEDKVVNVIKNIMLPSRETLVKYMTPLGLHHIMGYDHHYGPGPWVSNKPRQDWTSVYYHRADSLGVGYDRSSSGSNSLEQYHPEVQKQFTPAASCDEKFLLWFHHVSWDFQLKSGNTLWDQLCYDYYSGVEEVKKMKSDWKTLEGKVDDERFRQVQSFLSIQEAEAIMWRDACVLYFQTFSKKAIPKKLSSPEKSLEYYMNLSFPYAPGIRPKW